ncbi:MAG: hypothetical protein M3Q97_07750, partial [Bacteroidota bacterium]|nr:hypothetical protein [Bacteroidota bacterium]
AHPDADYTDRQHTSKDILGVDTDGDGEIDSFYVDFNYLSRNTVINGAGIAAIALSPEPPDFTLGYGWSNDLEVTIIDPDPGKGYRIAIRSTINDWDSVYTVSATGLHSISVAPQVRYYVSVAEINDSDIESLFSIERSILATGIEEKESTDIPPIELMQNKPNPFDEATTISVMVNEVSPYSDAYISIKTLEGKEVSRLNITLNPGMNEVFYSHGYNVAGTFIYTLIVNGVSLHSRQMIFTN